MRHAFIAPINYLDMIPQESDFHLLLAHLLHDKRYCDFYREKKKRGDYIIIDNGAFEFKKPMDVDEYEELIEKSGIIPNVIVAPDYPYDNWKKTIDSAINFIDKAVSRFGKDVGIMVVPQSEEDDWQGYMMGYRRVLDMSAVYKNVTTVGVSILGVPNAFHSLTGTSDITFNRNYASMIMKRIHDDNRHPSMKHHFLGCSDPREILMMKAIGLADSNDSSTAIWHGILGTRFDSSASGLIYGKSDIPVDFFLDKISGVERGVIDAAILHNIETIIDWLS